MSIIKWNIFRASWIKQISYLVSTPDRSQDAVMISESGVISRELLPLGTGFISGAKAKMAWLVLHPLKVRICGKDGNIEDNQVLLISERSYLPLDPFGKLSAREKANLAPLETIAKLRHAEARANVAEGNADAKSRMMQTIVSGCLVIIAMVVIFRVIMEFKGGAG